MRLDSGKASGKELERSWYVSFRVVCSLRHCIWSNMLRFSGRSVYVLVLNSVHP